MMIKIRVQNWGLGLGDLGLGIKIRDWGYGLGLGPGLRIMIGYLDQALVISFERLGIWDSNLFQGLEIFIADQALAIADLGLEIDWGLGFGIEMGILGI